MWKHNLTILALDPGTRKTGYAFFAGDELLFHGVKVLAQGRTPKQTLDYGHLAVLTLLRTLKPDVLAVEQAHFSNRTRRTALLNDFTNTIVALGKRERMRVFTFAPSTIKKFTTGYGWARKEQVARVVAHQYPELRAYLTGAKHWQTVHHGNMFDAVALGMLARQKL